ncbi:hypothetical protein JTB14_036329 [Gonioctena quinquepunctata]|nr:hypothetical protein JTB14_036329 [Gonioctena quinquepunctata]
MDEKPGYLGDYFKLNIVVEFNGKIQPMRFFAKFIPTSGNENSIKWAEAHLERKDLYTTISFQHLNNWTRVIDFCSKCFLVRTNECFIMEDLSSSGFASVDVLIPLDFDQCLGWGKNPSKIPLCSLLFEEKLEKRGKTVRMGDLPTIFRRDDALSR